MKISILTRIENPENCDAEELESSPEYFKKCCDMFPVRKKFFCIATQLLIILFLIGAMYGIFERKVFPGSELFALLLLGITAHLGGVIISCFKLPPLMGMMLVGILFRNLPFIPYYENISIMWSTTLRDISLAIILLKAGMGLDAQKLMELKLTVIKLSFIPCLVEAASSAVFTHYLLGLPWIWALMLGFIVAAVSAAILVPGILELEEKRLGLVKGIPTLILASVSLDNIAALTGFTVIFNVLTSSDSLTVTLVKRLLEPFVGFILGALIGILLWFLPEINTPKPTVVYNRILLLCLGGLSFIFASKRVGYPGAGALGCVSLAFIASFQWREQSEVFKNITWITGMFWLLIEPFLFGLIGAEVTIESLQTNLGYGILSLLLGIFIRVVATVIAMQCSPLNLREVIFVSTTWLSKATVQAAVGSQALDYSRTNNKGIEFETYGKQVLMLSVLSIILTAPLGAALLNGLGPYLLKKDGSVQNQPVESDDEESSPVNERKYTGYSSCSWTSTENYTFSNSELDFSANIPKSPRKLEPNKTQNLLKGNL